jgi:hypothetical protein
MRRTAKYSVGSLTCLLCLGLLLRAVPRVSHRIGGLAGHMTKTEPAAASALRRDSRVLVTGGPGASGSDTSADAVDSGTALSKRATTTRVICGPSSDVELGSSTNCTAIVTDSAQGTASTPRGIVTWSSSDGTFGPAAGSLFSPGPPPHCTLSDAGTMGVGSCAVSYAPGSAGPHAVTAKYEPTFATESHR